MRTLMKQSRERFLSAKEAGARDPRGLTFWVAALTFAVLAHGLLGAVANLGAARSQQPDPLTISREGNVGIGTATPGAKLSVSATGSELGGGVRSTTLVTNAGSLGTTKGNELALASFGFFSGSGNNSFLGVRAYRAADGSSWTSSAIGLGMDVDNTTRAGGASLWLSGNGNVGVGTAEPAAKLEVAGNVKASGIQFPDGTTQTSAGPPAHAVLAFNLTTCPAGWDEYAPARGRFVRGIDTTASKSTDPDGQRQPGATQEDAIRNITGSLSGVEGELNKAWPWGFKPLVEGAFSVVKNNDYYNKNPGDNYIPAKGIGTTATFDASRVVRTAAENRPKNVALLYCEKK
jgi:hypothetical protein